MNPQRIVAVLAIAAGVSTPAAAAPIPVLSPYMDLGAAGLVPQVGAVIQGYPGAWSGSPTGYVYSWERCGAGVCQAVPGADTTAYAPTAADVGFGLRLVVRALHPIESATASSTISAGVIAAPTPPAPQPETPPAATPPPPPPTPAPAGSVTVIAPPASPPAPPPPPVVQHVSVAAASPPAAPPAGPTIRLGTINRIAGFGSALRVEGTLGSGTPGRRVTVLDGGGLPVADAIADGNGSFRAWAPAQRPGTWNVHIDGATASFAVKVRPRVLDLAATPRVRRPGIVAVKGRIEPAISGKVVHLQYLDPRRGWKVWRHATTGPGGHFRVARVLPKAPGVRPFRLRIRVGVPTDVGWIFAPAVSATRVVSVR